MHKWVTFRDVRQCLESPELGASPAPLLSAEGSWVLGLPKRTHPSDSVGKTPPADGPLLTTDHRPLWSAY